MGEDTGGSGRGPASYCGVVGLRPTFTRVTRHGMTPMCWFMDAAAPMTKTVEDCALLLGTVAGHDPDDPYTSRRPVPDYTAYLGQDIRGLRVGLIRELHETEDVHPEVKGAIESVLEMFRSLGCQVREVSIPLIAKGRSDFCRDCRYRRERGARDDILRTRPEDLDRASRTRLQSAALVPAKVYNRAAKARVLLRRQFMEALDQVDVLVSATAPYPAPKHTDLTATFADADDVRTRFFFRRSYTGCYALAALPAISLPGGFASENLPIGLQLGARPFAEETLLRAGHAYGAGHSLASTVGSRTATLGRRPVHQVRVNRHRAQRPEVFYPLPQEWLNDYCLVVIAIPRAFSLGRFHCHLSYPAFPQ